MWPYDGRMRSLPLLFLLAGCGLTTEGAFPSLQPRPGEIARDIQPPGGGAALVLSSEERAALTGDLARLEQKLAAARSDIRVADSELAAALSAATAAPIGSEAWSIAQLKLSRFDQARSPLSEISGSLGPARIMVDSLAESDPDRVRLGTLDRDTDQLLRQTLATAKAADRALARS